MRPPLVRGQHSPVVQGVLCLVLTLAVLQLWLLTATLNAYLGGDESVLWPAAVVSLVCVGLNVRLLSYLPGTEPPARLPLP